jgi:ABC-2 type transport system permease protein
MSSPESTAMPESPEPLPNSQVGGSAAGPVALSSVRLAYWSVLRELWEHRWLYIALLIVAAVFLGGFVIGAARLPLSRIMGSPRLPMMRLVAAPFDFASGALMLTYVVVAVIYCLAALHTERSDRSILFWKSLPVSNSTTVIAKAVIPVVILPLVTFAIIVVTHIVMLLAGSAVLLGRGIEVGPLWAQISLLPMWAAILYHLVTVHALYWAPFYGWLLLASAWARRAALLWAGVPVAAVLIIEKLVFNTSAFGHMLLSQLGGGPAAIPFPPPENMTMQAPTLANLGAFLASPGLWVGLAVCAIFLAAAAHLRKYQGPI